MSTDTKPDPSTHVRIVSFGEKLLTMSSIRKPKRLTIHGNDEKEYMFLVKVCDSESQLLAVPSHGFVIHCLVPSQGGEDLRLDQRIEQLFEVMNVILKESGPAAKRGLRLGTYKVIPMTGSVGMIEWVKNTRPLKVCLVLSCCGAVAACGMIVPWLVQSIIETGLAVRMKKPDFDLLHDDKSPNQVRQKELMTKYGVSSWFEPAFV